MSQCVFFWFIRDPNKPASDVWPQYDSGTFIEWGRDPLVNVIKPLSELRAEECSVWDTINTERNRDVIIG